MYKCSACGYNSAPGEDQRKHIVQRDIPKALWSSETRKEIVAEMPVCHNCYQLLQDGESFGNLHRRYHQWREVPLSVTAVKNRGKNLLAK